VVEVRPVGDPQHDANSAAIEKRHVGRRLKKKNHAERIAIKSDRPIEVLHVDKDLSDLR